MGLAAAAAAAAAVAVVCLVAAMLRQASFTVLHLVVCLSSHESFDEGIFS